MRPLNLIWLITSIVLSGCSYREETKKYGVFTFTDYFQKDLLDWEGGNEGVVAQKLCGDKSNFCVKANYIDLTLPGIGRDEWKLLPAQPWLIVLKKAEVTDHVRFYNASTGAEIFCTNCNDQTEKKLDFDGGTLRNEFWMHGAKRVLIQSGPRDHSKVSFDYLEFQGDHVEFHHIVDLSRDDESTEEPVIHLRLNEMDFIAWMYCGTEKACKASTFDFKSRTSKLDIAECKPGQTIWVEAQVPRCVSTDEYIVLEDDDMRRRGVVNPYQRFKPYK